MKTIKKDEIIKRVSDDIADIRVKEDGWDFIAKKEWKDSIRDSAKNEKIKTEYDEQEMTRSVEKPRKEQVTNQSKKKINKKKR